MKKYFKYFNKHEIFFIILVFFTVAICVLRSFKKVSNWKYTHWIFNYEEEFVKRGLIGEFLRLFDVRVTYEYVQIFSAVLIFFVVCSLLFVFVLPLKKCPQKIGMHLFFFCAVANPATLQHFIFDAGRFDGFCLLSALLSLLAVEFFSQYRSLFLIFALSIFSILVHEASFFIYIPLIFSYFAYKNNNNLNLYTLFGAIIALFLSTYAISVLGLVQLYDIDRYYELLTIKHGFHINKNSLSVLYNGSLDFNIRMTMEKVLNMNNFIHHLVMFLVFSPFIFLFYSSLKCYLRKTSYFKIVFMGSSLSPLFLYPLGFDHFRWWSLAITNLIISVCILSLDDEALLNLISETFYKYRNISILFIIISLMVGPLCVMSSFKFVDFILL